MVTIKIVLSMHNNNIIIDIIANFVIIKQDYQNTNILLQ